MLLDDVAHAAEHVAQADEVVKRALDDLTSARAELLAAIGRAVAEGVGITRIGRAAHMSRDRVYRLMREGWKSGPQSKRGTHDDG